MTDTTTKNQSSVATMLWVVPRWIQSTMERLAYTSLGQAALRQLDKFLWVIEKSAEWSLPHNEIYSAEDISDEDEESSERTVKLTRPLPWILFLPGLVILRSIRVGLNIGAFILGSPRIEPITVVRFVQRNRRHLKCLKSPNGSPRTKFKRKPQDKRLLMNEAKKALIRSIRLTLSTLSCLDGSKPSLSPPPTRIHVSALDLDVTSTPAERSPTESAESLKPIAERKDIVETISSDNSDSTDDSTDDLADETLQEKINRLALETSTEDPDFVPSASSTFSSDENDCLNEDDLNVSQNELQDITDDAETLHKTTIHISSDEIQQKQRSREQETSDKKDRDKAECDLSPHSSDSREYRTPSRLSQDGEGPFYSPTSSKTGTPERSVSPTNVKSSQQTDVPETNEFGNGEVRFASESTTSGRPLEETNNTAEKRNTNANKHHHKGKRTSHGSRKKK